MTSSNGDRRPLIIIVGVCAAGKTTLQNGLRKLGLNAHSIAQEHSVSPRFWRRKNPDVLIYLECTYETTKQRKAVRWGIETHNRQKEILKDARENADIFITTDGFLPEELIETALSELRAKSFYE
ncbi:MAG: hypothetical protein GX020_02730 [Firmicutes bacterium]|nr:hypothetical protein [Bacillota bacterium]